MPALDVPLPQGDDANDAKARSEEARMRLALEKLGTRSTPPVRSRPGATAGAAHAAPHRRNRFVREGEVPVEHVPTPVRSPIDLQRELTEERAARQRAEQALGDAQARVGALQAALSRSEQSARAAREAIEERGAAMAGLRAELQRATVEKAVPTGEPPTRVKVRGRASTARATPSRVQDASEVEGPQPVKWWLPLTRPGG